MPRMSKKSKLVCITGFMGAGKSTSINFFYDMGYEVFNVDKWIHKIYEYNKIGYKLIVKLFGKKYVNKKQVDRKKIKELILNNPIAKNRLEKNINHLIFKKLQQLKQKNRLIFVELATYLYKSSFFYPLFFKIILVVNNQKTLKNDDFKKFSLIKKFSTKPVGNLKKLDKHGVFYVDFIVENKLDTTFLKKQLNFILKKI